MQERDTNWQKKTKKNKNDLLVVVDASSLIRMAAYMNPQDISKTAPDNPSLLRFLEHIASLGVEVIIPESTIFETTGHRADGRQLTKQFERDIEYPNLRGFFDDVRSGKIKNVHIVSTELGNKHLEQMELLQPYWSAFNQYRRENLIGFGDRDIVTWLDHNTHRGRIFVLTEDRGLSNILSETQNAVNRPVNVMDTITFCHDTQLAAPMPWLDPAVMGNAVRKTINHFITHNNQKRAAYNIDSHTNTYNSSYKGYARIAEGEVSFGEALHDMIHSKELDR